VYPPVRQPQTISVKGGSSNDQGGKKAKPGKQVRGVCMQFLCGVCAVCVCVRSMCLCVYAWKAGEGVCMQLCVCTSQCVRFRPSRLRGVGWGEQQWSGREEGQVWKAR